MKLLLIRFSSLGDVVLTTPLVRALRAAYPDARIDFATQEAFAPVLESNPHVDRVLTLPGKDMGALRAFARTLRTERYDRVLDLHGSIRSIVLRLLVRGPRWSVYPKETLRRWLLVKLRIGQKRTEIVPVPERYFGAAKGLDVSPDGGPAEIHPPPAAVSEAESALLDAGLLGTPFVAIAPGARHATKRWPPSRWAELATKLQADGLRTVLIGGPEDAELSAEIVSAAPSAVDLVGSLSVLGSTAVLERAACVASGDTGVMHLATAVGVPVVALFGPTARPLGFFPYAARATVVERDLPCRPCSTHGGDTCPLGHHYCMLGLDVPRVEAAVRRAVGELVVTPSSP